MRDHDREATIDERRFLEASNKARAQRQRRRLLNRIAASVGAIILVLALLAIKYGLETPPSRRELAGPESSWRQHSGTLRPTLS